MLEEIAQALADALESVADAVVADGDELVVQPWFVANPAAPTIDIYPGGESEGLGFGDERRKVWNVRARIHTAEHVGAQSVLLALLEDTGDTSVEAALLADQTLGGVVESLDVVSGFEYIEFIDRAGVLQNLGVLWRVEVLTKAEVES